VLGTDPTEAASGNDAFSISYDRATNTFTVIADVVTDIYTDCILSRFIELVPQLSTNLVSWTDVTTAPAAQNLGPVTRLSWTVPAAAQPGPGFVRLRVTLAP